MHEINDRFEKLTIIIFNKTIGIRPYHNERKAMFMEYFGTGNLGRDIQKIRNGEPLPQPDIYKKTIKRFFSEDRDGVIPIVQSLTEELVSENYLIGIDASFLSSNCNLNTLKEYRELISEIWKYYYNLYLSDEINCWEYFSIPQKIIDNIVRKNRYRSLPVDADFYRKRASEIDEFLKIMTPDEVFTLLKTEYEFLFNNVISHRNTYTLTNGEERIFVETLYVYSNLLDKVHHEDSYDVNLYILDFLNREYNDSFYESSIADIRRIQGCIYAIAVDKPENSTKGNIGLTLHNNIFRKETGYKSITVGEKLYICNKAIRNLLNNKTMRQFNKTYEENGEIGLFENRLKKGRKYISQVELEKLCVLTLVYSNIAACTLQYIKQVINVPKHAEYKEICEEYHNRSRYIRCLIVRITEKVFGKDHSKYKKAIEFLAEYYNSVATRYYYIKKYDDCIVIRSVLFNFYLACGMEKKAYEQTKLAAGAIAYYEKNGGSADFYKKKESKFFNERKKDFSYLCTNEIPKYEDFKKILR